MRHFSSLQSVANGHGPTASAWGPQEGVVENGVGGRAPTPPKGPQQTVTCKTVGPGSPDLARQKKPYNSLGVRRRLVEEKPINDVWARGGCSCLGQAQLGRPSLVRSMPRVPK